MEIDCSQLDLNEVNNSSEALTNLLKAELPQKEQQKPIHLQSTQNKSQPYLNVAFSSEDIDDIDLNSVSSFNLRKKRKRSFRKKTKVQSMKIRIELPLGMSNCLNQPTIEKEVEDDNDKEKEVHSTTVDDNPFKIVITQPDLDIQENITLGSECIPFSHPLKTFFKKEITEFNKSKNSPFIPPMLKTNTYINCDLRYFNFFTITQRIGFFDVILCDPPWRIKGGQRNNSSHMFSNSSFKLDYNTLSCPDIMNIQVEALSQKGFCYLWVLNSLLDEGISILNKWGYTVVDQIAWVKLRNSLKPSVQSTQGYFFLHCFELCLVGYKCPKGMHVDYRPKGSSNLIMAKVGKQSQKPEELYHIIESISPGSKKIELFARNHNLREGWLSLGNQLGENYLPYKEAVTCNNCNCLIQFQTKRYKFKLKGNYDLCEQCFQYIDETMMIGNFSELDFFELNNDITDEVYHENIACDKCQTTPIRGLRFKSRTDLVDLCEACFDCLSKGRDGFDCLELPDLTQGLAVHYGLSCKSCYQKPIVGICFECKQCMNYCLCQRCYFNSNTINDLHSGNNANSEHTLVIKSSHKVDPSMKFKCNECKIKYNQGKRKFQCKVCNEYYLCEACFNKRKELSYINTNHKPYHTFYP